MKPYVSIIVPVYNVEPYIEACLRSVMRQTYQGRMECIVVDDCGTDQSMEIVSKLISDYSGHIIFQVVHHDHNRGLSAARNTGIDIAKGDYLFFMDSDDELTDDCIERLSEPLQESCWDIVIGKFETLDEEGSFDNTLHGVLKLPDKTCLKGKEVVDSYCNEEWVSMAWNKLYRTDTVRMHQIRFLEGICFEDEPWTLQMACISQSLFVVRQTTYLYRRRTNSITTIAQNDKSIAVDAFFHYVVEMVRFVEKNHIQNENVPKLIRGKFYETLNLTFPSLLLFIRRYRLMRQQIDRLPQDFINSKNKSRKRKLRDFHLSLPLLLAPYIEYGVCLSIMLFRKIIK